VKHSATKGKSRLAIKTNERNYKETFELIQQFQSNYSIWTKGHKKERIFKEKKTLEKWRKFLSPT